MGFEKRLGRGRRHPGGDRRLRHVARRIRTSWRPTPRAAFTARRGMRPRGRWSTPRARTGRAAAAAGTSRSVATAASSTNGPAATCAETEPAPAPAPPGARRCHGRTVELCNSSGQWNNQGTCQFACQSGQCTGECTPGATQCHGTAVQMCSSAGQWNNQGTCQFVCQSGQCTGECQPGARQCHGTAVQMCSSVGQWVTQGTCQFVCQSGQCTGECRAWRQTMPRHRRPDVQFRGPMGHPGYVPVQLLERAMCGRLTRSRDAPSYSEDVHQAR